MNSRGFVATSARDKQSERCSICQPPQIRHREPGRSPGGKLPQIVVPADVGTREVDALQSGA